MAVPVPAFEVRVIGVSRADLVMVDVLSDVEGTVESGSIHQQREWKMSTKYSKESCISFDTNKHFQPN